MLAAWLVAVFGVSAVSDLPALGVLWAASVVLLWRGAGKALLKVLKSALPLTLFLGLASWGWVWLLERQAPDFLPFAALLARTCLIAFLTFAVLDRVKLLPALAPWPTLARLLTISLAQIHALRLLLSESALALKSRLPHKPTTRTVLANSGGLTGAMLSISTRNAREITEAMRSRGFS
jgi:cobalt/nickel transport system permease protein